MATGAWPRDEAEFERSYLEHFEGVYRLGYRIAGSAADAEDLAQEAFLRLHRRALGAPEPTAPASGGNHPGPAREGREEAGTETSRVRAWLFRVVMHLAYNAVRDRRRREVRHRRAGQRDASAERDAGDPAEDFRRKEERQAVRRALQGLSERQSQILLLRHSGLSYQEVSDVLEISPGSVGTLLARAEAAFAEAYRRLAGPRTGVSHDA